MVKKVLITVMRKKPASTSEPVKTTKAIAQGFAQDAMANLAKNGGKSMVRPISEFAVKDGKVGYSAGLEITSIFGRKSHFVQYSTF